MNLLEIEILKGNILESADITDLKNQILTNITATQTEIIFTCANNKVYKMYHIQESQEHVDIEDINGDFEDLIGYPVLQAEEASNSDDNLDAYYTYTFYKIGTVKGTVTIRWYGESNGCYSEKVDFVRIK